MLFPFVAFMVEDLGYRGSKLGYYVGGLAASFCGAQFCSSILWGVFSDKYGRKPAIAIGTLGAAVGMLIFGFATNYPTALIGRIISGFLTGNIGVLKSFLTEITDESNRAAGFSYLSAAWAFGTIIAPLAGGLLCRPALKYPKYFVEADIFCIYPYLLPCMICFAFNVLSGVACQLFMVETRIFKQDATVSTTANPQSIIGMASNRKVLNGSSGGEIPESSLPDSMPIAQIDGHRKANGLLGLALQNIGGTLHKSRLYVVKSFLQSNEQVNHIPYEALDVEKAPGHLGDKNHAEEDCRASADYPTMTARNVRGTIGASSITIDSTSIIACPTTNVLHKSDHYVSDVPSSQQRSTDDDESTNENLSDSNDDSEPDDDEYDDEEECECCLFSCGREGDTSNGNRDRYRTLNAPCSSSKTSNLEESDGDTQIESPDSRSNRSQLEKSMRHSYRRGQQARNVMRSRSVILVTCNYGLLAMAIILWEETIPLFFKLDLREGGFGMTSGDIGLILSLSGGVLFVFTYFILPTLAKENKKWLFNLGVYGALLITFGIPLLASAKTAYPITFASTEGTLFLKSMLVACVVLKNIAACTSFTA